MADETLSQDPLLVIPAALQNAAKQYFRDVNAGNVVVDPKNRSVERSAELGKLATFLASTYGPIYNNGVAYLRNLAAMLPSAPRPQLELLLRGEHRDISRIWSFDRPVDEAFVPHKLQVHFPRDPGRMLA